ncbi:hypothetical protein GCM10009554_01380 [Kribbella koreensis]|uniref:Uncharacterized protein n=1 Tax=Kribbella koreensis TaxID=57909 RepID=A0ABP3ZKY1_9ACTN
MLGPAFFPDLHQTALTSPAIPWSEYLDGLRPTPNPSAGLGNRAEPTMSASRAQQWNDFLTALDLVGQLSFPTGSSVSKLA